MSVVVLAVDQKKFRNNALFNTNFMYTAGFLLCCIKILVPHKVLINTSVGYQ